MLKTRRQACATARDAAVGGTDSPRTGPDSMRCSPPTLHSSTAGASRRSDTAVTTHPTTVGAVGRGIHERSAKSILLSLTVTFFFGGMLWGVLPSVGPGISWEGHLFGFLGGLLVSRLLGRELRGRRR